jgi:hypothetical protein
MVIWKPFALPSTSTAEVCQPLIISSSSFLEALGFAGTQLHYQRFARMKLPSVENIVVDEVHQRTYVVMAERVLTDGELYRAIRLEILKRGSCIAKGERLVITVSK